MFEDISIEEYNKGVEDFINALPVRDKAKLWKLVAEQSEEDFVKYNLKVNLIRIKAKIKSQEFIKENMIAQTACLLDSI